MSTPHALFIDFLARKGLKLTNQRRLILDVFLAQDGHPAPEELHAAVKAVDKSIGQATVYRTLKLLSNSGLAKEVHFGDGMTRYERMYGQSHHDHLICESCGRTIEIMDPVIEKRQEELAVKYGFTLARHKMDLYGQCPDCRRKPD